MPADVGRVEPLERDHPRRARARDGGPHRRQPSLELAAQLVGCLRDPGRLAEPDHVLEHLAQRARVLLNDPGLARQPGGDLDHVLEGDGADLADRLGDDQVGRELGQQLLVELVQRLPLADASPSPPLSISPAPRPAGRTVRVRWGRDAPRAGSRTRG